MKIEFYEVWETVSLFIELRNNIVSSNYDIYHVILRGLSCISLGRTKEKKSLEVGLDWRPLWRQDNRPGQALHLLWEPRMESLQVSSAGGDGDGGD